MLCTNHRALLRCCSQQREKEESVVGVSHAAPSDLLVLVRSLQPSSLSLRAYQAHYKSFGFQLWVGLSVFTLAAHHLPQSLGNYCPGRRMTKQGLEVEEDSKIFITFFFKNPYGFLFVT
ncbi:hypothetical protein GOP47_0006439 [Adiantum capillus-veneris]|uniref:Uncharacterized protein n=1 Tax=Adiantum capillus-veneris TaxID=13818 RepID=A0A9D4V3V7_ADICA|nr:hypothetical protein GOP47_0006439 [Adiantum capillus-veneris]